MQQAKNGELVGVALVAIFGGFRYSIHIEGEAGQIPTFTRGAVDVLHDDLGELIAIKRTAGPQ